MNRYLGSFEYKLDGKGRVALPSSFRSDGDRRDSFVLLQWRPPALTLLPEATWEKVAERLLEYRRSDPEAWAHARRITGAAAPVTTDSQGRILIPAAHQEMGSLDGPVKIVGVIDRIELWNPKLYDAEPGDGGDRFREFAQHIFG